MKNYNKKGQVAIFLIIAAVLFLGGVLFFFLTTTAEEPHEAELQILQEKTPIEFDPIRSFVTNCVDQISTQGLKLIGEHGGYISFSDRTLNRDPFRITSNPTETEAVQFSPDADLRTAYWWYLKSSNDCTSDCTFASKRPDLRNSQNSIEKQLERYITKELPNCLDNFEAFKDQGFTIEESSDIKTDVVIGTDDVSVVVNYPIKATSQTSQSDLTQFITTIPVDLETVYDLATKIVNLQMEHHFIEKHILNLIAAFSGVDDTRLPPMSDMQFKFGSRKSWQKTEVKSQVTGLLSSYIPLFQVDGTANYERNFFNSDLRQRLYDSTILPVANESFRNIATEFTYLDFWPAYFNLNCDGEICRPSSGNSIISFLGIQTYRFNYDLSFPVLIEVTDTNALFGEGYTLNIFVEGNIRDNEFLDTEYNPLQLSSISQRSQLCDVKSSGNITIDVIDKSTKEEIGDVQILYTVAGESCYIGQTTGGQLKDQFPVGIGGFAGIVKDGYIGKSIEIEPRIDEDDSLKVELEPISTKKVIIRKKEIKKTTEINSRGRPITKWRFVDDELDLTDKEQSIITITRIGSDDELEFSSVSEYQGGQVADSEIEIAPGRYELEISSLQNEHIVIPESEKCGGVWPVRSCTTIPKIDFGEGSDPGEEQFPVGGLKMEFIITADDLKDDTLVFNTLHLDLASVPEAQRTIEDLEQLDKLEDYGSIYRYYLTPKTE